MTTGATVSSFSSADPQLALNHQRLDRMAEAIGGAQKKKKHKGTRDRRNEILVNVPTASSEPWLRRLTSSRYYEAISATLIIVNATLIGTQIEFMCNRAFQDAANNQPVRTDVPEAFHALEVVFCLIFSIELGLRWVGHGLVGFFRGSDLWWNVLDVGVVLLSILDLLFADNEGPLGNISALRVLRVVRVVRVARIIRIMRFFRELRMMIFSILGSVKSLIWVIYVLGLMFHLFGVTFAAATTSHLNRTGGWHAAETADLREYFGTLSRAMLSLFMSMSGGNDWGQYYDALSPLPGIYGALFLLFIVFAVFCVVNIVTGVFVDSALQSNQKDKNIVVHEEMEAKKEYLSSMRDIFEEMDTDDTGCITVEEFERKLDDEHVIAYFNALKLDVSDARTVFRLLDHDMDNAVNIDEFLSGCYRLQGESRSLDMKIMQCEVRFLQEHFGVMLSTLKEVQEQLARNAAPQEFAHAAWG